MRLRDLLPLTVGHHINICDFRYNLLYRIIPTSCQSKLLEPYLDKIVLSIIAESTRYLSVVIDTD